MTITTEPAEPASGPVRARQPLNRRRVLEAALALVDREGLAELTIRRLGLELGVEGMSLYRHVADKDAVLDGIVELLWAELPASPDGEGDWRPALRELAAGLRGVCGRHPAAAPLLVSRNFINAPALRCYDAYLTVLRRAGFERRRALDAICAVGGQALGFGLMEVRCLAPAADAGASESDLQRLRRVTRSLPDDLPDSLIALAMELTGTCDFDRCFEISIAALIAGLEP
jgi:AcrR family transcriptional regulator